MANWIHICLILFVLTNYKKIAKWSSLAEHIVVFFIKYFSLCNEGNCFIAQFNKLFVGINKKITYDLNFPWNLPQKHPLAFLRLSCYHGYGYANYVMRDLFINIIHCQLGQDEMDRFLRYDISLNNPFACKWPIKSIDLNSCGKQSWICFWGKGQGKLVFTGIFRASVDSGALCSFVWW